MIKVVLLIGGKRYNVTDDLKNWDEVEVSAKRKDLGGIIRTFSNEFEFVKGAYQLIEQEYLTNYLKASAVIIVGVLNDSWSYNEKFRCNLDFSTYQSDGYTISINGVDDSVASVINANKSQVYDIPVSELSPSSLYYDRMDLNNKAEWSVNPNDQNTEQSAPDVYPIEYFGNFEFPLVYSNINFPVRNKIEVYDAGGYVAESINVGPIVKGISNTHVKLRLDFVIRQREESVDHLMIYPDLLLWIFKSGKDPRKIKIASLDGTQDVHIDYTFDGYLNQGDYMSLFIDSKTLQTLHANVFDVKEISISYISRNKPVSIDTFTPDKLITSLLSKMGLTLSGEMSTGSMPIPYIAAAESIRGIKDAKVHTSFSKFCEFAKAVLGYDYEISDNKVIFKHISSFFDSKQVITLDYANSLDFTVNESMIYSGVDVGFEKKEYDEINGRDEFHVTSSFSTGVNVKDNVLKLISPYRADHYGIEFLANKRDEDSKDDSSDNDLFIMDAKVYEGKLALRRPSNSGASLDITGVLFPQSVFNVAYSPRSMLIANKDYLAACTDYLSFTASNGNSSVAIVGIPETQSISLTEAERIFRIEDINIDTVGFSPFPGEYKGLISFDYAGRIYQGYIREIIEKVGKKQTTSYHLLCSKII